MAFLSASVPKKVSDNQFIGDLMNLFERRKIKCGDPASLENFAATLAANDAFRSQLFTLCTAISHMAAEDLSGEQLLALVARALGGPGLPKRAGPVAIPDSMRTAFLAGYEAWTNRSSEPKEPLPWPSPAQPSPSQPDQLADTAPPSPAAAETAAPKPPAAVRHTVQEAIDIAKERALASAPPQPAPGLAANLEGLTLSELKHLLEDIEHRVHRIQPHLQELASAPRPAADGSHLRERIREIEAAQSLQPAAPELASANDPASSQSAHRAPHPSRINEAAFLARHSYLRSTRQPAPGSPAASGSPAPAASPAPAPSAAPLFAVAPAAATPLPQPEPVAAAPIDPAPAAPIAAPPAVVVAPPPPIELHPAAPAVHPEPVLFAPPPEHASLRVGRVRVSSGAAFASLAIFAIFIVVISGVAGLLIYPSLHPKTINDFPGLKPAAPASSSAAPASSPPDYANSGAQLILSAPMDPSTSPDSPASYSRPASRAAAPKPRAAAQASPPVAVWPYLPQPTTRDTAPAPASSSANSAARRLAPLPGPIYVPSSTIIGYALSAPQPAYPADEPRGITGTVVVQVTISREGRVTAIRAVSGPDELRPATIQSVEAWRFRPYLVEGSPAEVITTFGFLFRGQ